MAPSLKPALCYYVFTYFWHQSRDKQNMIVTVRMQSDEGNFSTAAMKFRGLKMIRNGIKGGGREEGHKGAMQLMGKRLVV